VDSATLEALEYDEILKILSGFALTGPGMELVLKTRPLTDADALSADYDRFSDTEALVGPGARLPLGGAHDIRPVLERAFPEGAFLLAEDLLLIKDNLHVSARLREMAGPGFTEKYPAISPLFTALSDNRLLLARLERTIDEKGLILDSASPGLRSIRRRLRNSRTRIRKILEEVIKSPAYRDVLREDIITIRDDRFVLSVVAGKQSEVPGIIHGRSGSGATFFIEPLALVEFNNSLSILKKEERAEEREILREVTTEVMEAREGLLADLQIIADLDVLGAKVAFAHKTGAMRPEVSTTGGIHFKGARHPLLVLKELGGGPPVVPVEITTGQDTRVMVISGANTGGKTVALKTTGLLTLMAASGIPITAGPGSRARVFTEVFADVGDRQDIGASLSTFSAHVRRLSLFLEEAGPGSLVLIDEIGAGTDPAEAEALGLAVLESLKSRGALSIVTTHLNLIKAHAAVDPAYENVSVEFDEATLKPRYRLEYGLPGPSLGINIAGALGLPRDIIDRALRFMKGGEGAFMESLRLIEEEKERLRQKEARLEELEKRRARELARLRAERDVLIGRAKKRIDAVVEEAREEVRRLREEFARKKKKDIPAAAAIAGTGQRYKERLSPARGPRKGVVPEVGQRVRLSGSRTRGVVTRLDREAGRCEVLMGSVKVWVDMKRVEPLGLKDETRTGANGHVEFRSAPGSVPHGSINLIGMRVEEAVAELTRFIDNAHLAGLEVVEVIHGMGTGALKKAVAEHLRGRSEVKSFEPGPPEAGGAGMTVVYLQ